MTLYQAIVVLHVLAALLWLGGMFFLAVVAAPVLRGVDPPEVRAVLFQRIGLRFRAVGWGAIGVLVATGAASLWLRGVLSGGVLGDRAFWGTPFGRALAWKLAAVAGMVALSAVHDFVLGPRASRLAGRRDREAVRARRAAAWLARANALLGLLLVWAAVRLARGG